MKVDADRAKLVAETVLDMLEKDQKITHITFELVEHNGKTAVSIVSTKEPTVIVI